LDFGFEEEGWVLTRTVKFRNPKSKIQNPKSKMRQTSLYSESTSSLDKATR